MRRVVIESPYGSKDPNTVAENVAYAKECVLDCLKKHEAPYASHLFFTQEGILDDNDKGQRELGIAAGFAWADAAELACFYIDRGMSPGMSDALTRCVKNKTPYEFRAIYEPVAKVAARLHREKT